MNEPKSHGGSLVWFLAPNCDIQIDDTFREMVGVDADSIRKNKVPTPAAPFLALAELRSDELQISLLQQTGRLDLSVKPLENPASPNMPLTELMSVLKVLKKALELPDRLPDALRISCVIGYAEEASSQLDATIRFKQFTGFDCGFDDPSDLMIQVNRRSRFGDILGNRLVTANTVEMQSMQISPQNGTILSSGPTEYAIMVTLDFNTIPDGSVFDTSSQRSTFASIFEEVDRAVLARNLSFLKARK